MRRGLLALLAVLAGVLLAATGVYANDGPYEKYPPDLAVYKNGVLLQKAHTKAFKWTWWDRDDHRWWTDSYTYPPEDVSWPVEDAAKASQVITLRYMRPTEPANVVLTSYRNRAMTGEGRTLGYGWKPVTNEAGKVVGWDILFKPQGPGRPHYIVAYIYWRHEPGSHHSYGWSKELVHLHTYQRGTH
jgi:hypothetical protein